MCLFKMIENEKIEREYWTKRFTCCFMRHSIYSAYMLRFSACLFQLFTSSYTQSIPFCKKTSGISLQTHIQSLDFQQCVIENWKCPQIHLWFHQNFPLDATIDYRSSKSPNVSSSTSFLNIHFYSHSFIIFLFITNVLLSTHSALNFE